MSAERCSLLTVAGWADRLEGGLTKVIQLSSIFVHSVSSLCLPSLSVSTFVPAVLLFASALCCMPSELTLHYSTVSLCQSER